MYNVDTGERVVMNRGVLITGVGPGGIRRDAGVGGRRADGVFAVSISTK